MAFLPSIPQATDALSTSQGNILNNFTILGAIAGNANPSSASINATVGFNWIYLSAQGAIPPTGSAFVANNIALYSATNPTTSKRELYITKQDQATTVQIPATASTLSVTSAPGSLSSGFTYLPSGVIIQWGQFNGTGSNPYMVTFPIAFPNAIFVVTATARTSGGFYVTGTLTTTTFLVSSSTGNVSTGQFIAIGH